MFALLVFFSGLVGLYIVVDASFNQTRRLVKQERTAVEILSFLGNYYLYNIPVIAYDVMLGIILIAAIFSITLLNKNNELVPMMASGISVFRIMLPIILASVLLTAAQYVVKDMMIPGASETLVKMRMESKKKINRYMQKDIKDSEGNAFEIRLYDIDKKTMKDLVIALSPGAGETSSGNQKISANKAVYKRTPNGQSAWFLSDGKVRKFETGEGNIIETLFEFGDEGMVLVADARSGESCGTPYVISSITPEAIKKMEDRGLKDFYSIRKLKSIYKKKPQDWIEIEIWRRYTWPMVNLLLLAIGLPLVVLRQSANVYWSITMCLLLCIAFFFVDSMCVRLGMEGTLPAPLAVLLPFTIFGSVCGLIISYSHS